MITATGVNQKVTIYGFSIADMSTKKAYSSGFVIDLIRYKKSEGFIVFNCRSGIGGRPLPYAEFVGTRAHFIENTSSTNGRTKRHLLWSSFC